MGLKWIEGPSAVSPQTGSGRVQRYQARFALWLTALHLARRQCMGIHTDNEAAPTG
ncbi:hypothetical protein BQ8794_240286 [Mesorhizobium prunaredense]|uniref:Uncharacterized protein n=1 Tax=Mesorhizobium prunaredense TaxID=1631249 RepID=A0A1R3VBB5_9HYPH|nr:hypothetical protein BQ8794_240286 [Mesorhizobium prunaredense]